MPLRKLKHLLLFLLMTSVTFASKVDTLVVFSESMQKDIKNIVITPDSYKKKEQSYSVLYLLHRAGGDYKAWLGKAPNIKKYADPTHRAITGYSMSGHGALYLAFRHTDIWGIAGSMSGGVDIRPYSRGWDISDRLGNYAENEENWERNSVINLVHKLNGKKIEILFDCGYDDFFYSDNKRLHEKSVERNIPHDYIERPGKHDSKYWSNSITFQMLFFKECFNKTPL